MMEATQIKQERLEKLKNLVVLFKRAEALEQLKPEVYCPDKRIFIPNIRIGQKLAKAIRYGRHLANEWGCSYSTVLDIVHELKLNEDNGPSH
jgi:hypothetical protein